MCGLPNSVLLRLLLPILKLSLKVFPRKICNFEYKKARKFVKLKYYKVSRDEKCTAAF